MTSTTTGVNVDIDFGVVVFPQGNSILKKKSFLKLAR